MEFGKYKVLEIVNDTTLLIDYGTRDGAKTGDSLRIIEKGEPIIIDETDYGTLDMIKDTVEVNTPYEKFSICRKIRIQHISALNPLEKFQESLRQPIKLNVDKSEISNRKIPTATPIKKGDIAIPISE